MSSNIRNTLMRAFLVFLLNTSISAMLFKKFEGLSTFDAIYWAVTVVSTVGFGDITPQTIWGKIIFMYLTLTSLAIYGYIIGTLGSLLVEIRITDALKRLLGVKRMTMERHIVVLGWNSVTSTAVSELLAQELSVVIVDDRDDVVALLASQNKRVIKGDPKEPAVLINANVRQARAVMIYLESDPETVMGILAVRSLSRDVKVIAGLKSKDYITLARQAGANEVVIIDEIGGRLMGSMIFEPFSAYLLQDLVSSISGEMDVVQAIVRSEETVGELEERRNVKVLRVRKVNMEIVDLPPRDHRLYPGDLIVFVSKLRES